eukprot:7653318-Alexandrium_andersonii.AAC.1
MCIRDSPSPRYSAIARCAGAVPPNHRLATRPAHVADDVVYVATEAIGRWEWLALEFPDDRLTDRVRAGEEPDPDLVVQAVRLERLDPPL